MNNIFGYILTPMVIVAALGAFSNAWNNAQTQAKLDQILSTLQPASGVGNLPRSALQSARYPQ